MSNSVDFASIYSTLFAKEWKGKAIWESIKDKELTSAPCLVGDQYNSQNVKVMVVGRAVNGWEVEFDDCSDLNSTVKSVMTQKNRLDDFASDCTEDEQGKKYYYATSSFLRMMRQLVGAFTGTEENWQQRLAWSNLFKISPRNGGNPSWLMIRNDIPLYYELIKEEIAQNKPDVVVFVTDMNYFDPYPNHKTYSSFRTLINETDLGAVQSEFICMAGSFVENPDVKLIVCKRPEFRPIAKMVADIVDTYNELKM